MSNSRRTFFIQSLSCATAPLILAMPNSAQAQNQTAVTDTDPQAVALGYQMDGSKTDVKKHPNYNVNQSCEGCALYQKSTDTTGSCAVFGNKLVAKKGWCGAWTKKA
jgi:High potential iron-sulfur protein